MIIKTSELNQIKTNNNSFILFYGANDGFKKNSINLITNGKEDTLHFEENEVLENHNHFISSLLTKSLFNEKKIILINRVTDKIFKIIEELTLKEPEDLKIILNAGNLEKKSKIRSFFEKNDKCICVPFYPDNEDTLLKIATSFFKAKNIAVSFSNINLIINRCNGDRGVLNNELEKIENYTKNGKKINDEALSKLTNLIENHDISKLIDNCLAKNKKKTVNIINDNNFTNEDCILIVRVFLNKLKKILKLSTDYKSSKNINLTISKAKPPIFWKDKEITKQQILKRKPEEIKFLIYKLNELELFSKKNFGSAINLITDFILEHSSETNNVI